MKLALSHSFLLPFTGSGGFASQRARFFGALRPICRKQSAFCADGRADLVHRSNRTSV